MSNAEKIQGAMDALAHVMIPASNDNVIMLSGIYTILAEVRDDLRKEVKNDGV